MGGRSNPALTLHMRLPSAHLSLVGLRATAAVRVRHPMGEFEAHFNEPSALTQDGSVRSRQPFLEARTIDVESLPKDTPLEFGDKLYRIKDQEPDGTGSTIVFLKR